MIKSLNALQQELDQAVAKRESDSNNIKELVKQIQARTAEEFLQNFNIKDFKWELEDHYNDRLICKAKVNLPKKYHDVRIPPPFAGISFTAAHGMVYIFSGRELTNKQFVEELVKFGCKLTISESLSTKIKQMKKEEERLIKAINELEEMTNGINKTH